MTRQRTTVGALLAVATVRLRSAGSSSPRLDAELLLGHALGWSRTTLLAHPERDVDAGVAARFWALVARRAEAEPMAYVLGLREFYGREFRVDRRALIPRPETELLVDLGLAAVARLRALHVAPSIVEVGTGSGAVAICVALETGVTVCATDVALDALALARENAAALGAEVRFIQADLLAPLRGPIHVVLANLPYVPTARDLPREVRDYEPHVAIFGGLRGTELIERLLRQAYDVLAPGGELCVELDEEDQAQPVAALARHLFADADVSVRQDAGGYDRVVCVLLPD